MSKVSERLLALEHFDKCYPTPHPLCVEAADLLDESEKALREIIAAPVTIAVPVEDVRWRHRVIARDMLAKLEGGK
tara:strand:- start:131 stop:358 length:228 start_codon:yes stop_codon:yes gene_type:complete